MMLSLLLRAARDQCWSGMAEANKAAARPRRPGERVFLMPDQLLHEAGTAAAKRFRPGNAGPSGFILSSLPV